MMRGAPRFTMMTQTGAAVPCGLEGMPDPAAVPHPHARRGAQGLWSPARASPPLGFIENPQHSVACTRAGPSPGEPTGTPRPHGSGDGDPGTASLHVPKAPSPKGHSTQMGTLERPPASWTLGEVAAPAQSPFRCRSGKAGSGKGLVETGLRLHAGRRETSTADDQTSARLRLQLETWGCSLQPGSDPLEGPPCSRPPLPRPARGRLPAGPPGPNPHSHKRLPRHPWGSGGPASALQPRPW